MSVPAMFSARMMVAVMPNPLAITKYKAAPAPRIPVSGGDGHTGGLVIECSSKPQKKATSHHRKTRPRKTQPWDIRRGPTVYPPLPPLPPEWTLVTDDAAAADGGGGGGAESAVVSQETVVVQS